MRRPGPAQGVLFGRQYIHIGQPTCLMCKVLLALAAVQDHDDCPGWVVPVPAWVLLPDRTDEPETLREAA